MYATGDQWGVRPAPAAFLAAATTDLLTTAGVDQIRLFNPADATAPPAWATIFPYAQTDQIDATDPDTMALTFGQAIADLTGQHLQRTP